MKSKIKIIKHIQIKYKVLKLKKRMNIKYNNEINVSLWTTTRTFIET